MAMAETEAEPALGTASYEYGCNVTDVKYNDGSVAVEFERMTGVRFSFNWFSLEGANSGNNVFRKGERSTQVHNLSSFSSLR